MLHALVARIRHRIQRRTQEVDREAQRMDLRGLALQARRSRRMLAIVRWFAVLGVLGALGVWLAMRQRGARTCAAATAAHVASSVAVSVCRTEYERTQDPGTGVRLVQVLQDAGDRDGASGIANGLLATSLRSDAFHLLGQIAASQGHLEKADNLFSIARAMHIVEAKSNWLARDLQALAELYNERGQLAEALMTAADCITTARAARDCNVETFCHVTAAN